MNAHTKSLKAISELFDSMNGETFLDELEQLKHIIDNEPTKILI